ncbi:MAG: DUF642 domain-containing protein [Myxococcales bacterium]|nr:DUF642 domain-containing protein [Myxococcales bacterium]
MKVNAGFFLIVLSASFGIANVALAACPDGVIDGAEECDDANNDNNDGCSALCEVEAGYTCSGGNVVNGDFEADPVPVPPGNWVSDAEPTGWTLRSNSNGVDIVGDGIYDNPSNSIAIRLAGVVGGNKTGAIFQNIETVEGETYTIHVLAASDFACVSEGTAPKPFTLSAAPASHPNTPLATDSFASSVDARASDAWTAHSLEFTASSNSTRVSFTGTSPDGSECGAVIDSVTVPTVCSLLDDDNDAGPDGGDVEPDDGGSGSDTDPADSGNPLPDAGPNGGVGGGGGCDCAVASQNSVPQISVFMLMGVALILRRRSSLRTLLRRGTAT